MDFPKRLRELRTEREISQEDLAAELNLGKSTISSYEIQGKQPNFQTLVDLADYFNVSTDYLLGVTPIRERYSEEQIKFLQGKGNKELLEYLEARTYPEDKAIEGLLTSILEIIQNKK